ncbi:hypothetical protein B4915_12255 [Leucobacter massiliensis]|uniref:Transglutaminase-like domain-containing protein n=1 Tax=Leucobacter massiliensis TaxID=1686285 RepID=A0A2S9QL64_9MICO|nr:hypothetical protein B4915_12255 [Leucobacter massiliensis]
MARRSAGPVRLLAGLLAAALAVTLGVAAAWPIYQTPRVWAVAGVALVLGSVVAWVRERWRLRPLVVVAVLLALFALSVVPVAVPQSFPAGFARGLLDGLAAVALGWKQLLTLSLPVGGYRTVLVPLYVVMLVAVLLIVVLAQRPGRRAAFAAIPMLAPVAFGTVFGASQLSEPLRLGPLTVVAPRELGVWLAAAGLAAVWVAWVSGADRRAALRLGRAGGGRRGSRWLRGFAGAAILAISLLAGLVIAPALDAGARTVPRDSVDPELVILDRPSPLAAYRGAKRDDTLDRPLFAVSGDRGLPPRLRIAVLDEYDGVDFHVSGAEAGRFTRFPSGEALARPSRVTVEVDAGYAGIWAPTARLGSPPDFSGPRAEALSDGFYVNRETGAAIAVPRGDADGGLRDGDVYAAEMETAEAEAEIGEPRSAAPLIDLEAAPELARWIERQQQGDDASGLLTLVERLRERGYLSHSLSEADGGRAWLDRLSAEYGTRFEPSAGGHSLVRVEELFEQLNTQQAAAGERPRPGMLVAAVGDDEQFATAAALVARALGYDSRVVLGVRTDGAGVPGVPACSEVCTGEHLAAWVEVRGDLGAWVPLDVTPQVEQPPQRLEEGEQLPEFPTTPEERDAQEVDPPAGLGEQGGSESGDAEDLALSWLWPLLRAAGLVAATVALLLIPALFLPLAKRRRARRRHALPDPELRALGAWEEMLDRARDAGVRLPAGTTRRETAEVLGTPPAVWAAHAVDRAVFSPDSIGEEDAEMVWRAAREDAAQRRAALGRWARLRAAYSLRSYGIGRGRREAPRPESETI